MIHQSTVDEFFAKDCLLLELQIAPPQIIRTKMLLKEKNFTLNDASTLAQLTDAIVREVKPHE